MIAQPLEDPLGRVALFFAAGLVVFQDLVDGSDPGVQLGPACGLLPPVARWHCVPQHFPHLLASQPNSLAVSRSLILSTTTARRTRAYNSTVYTSPVFHKTKLHENVRWNQSSTVWFCSADKRRSSGVCWSILISCPSSRRHERSGLLRCVTKLKP
jgi:hypothetical protein